MSGESVSATRSLRRRSKTVLIGIGIALGATVISAVAFAAWTTTGSGTAAGKAGTAAAVSISAVVPAGDLYPGVNGTASFTVTNNNGYAVKITQLTFSTEGIIVERDTAITVPEGATACSASFLKPPIGVTASDKKTYTVDFPQPIIVPANKQIEAVKLANAFSLDPSTPDSCQGAVFKVTVPSIAVTAA